MIFDITPKAPVLFGAGASLRTGMKVRNFGCKKVICIYDPGIKAAGIATQIVDNIKAAGVEVVEFGEVIPDPPDTLMEKAAELARQHNVDGVVGVGGGSSMDTAKVVNILLTNPSPVSQYYGFNKVSNPVKPLVLIPTTAGTGSEISFAAVITDTKNHVKTGIGGAACVPKLAIIDPELTVGLPPKATAETGMDAFSHVIESFTSAQENLMSQVLCEKAIQLILENLPKAVQNGSDLEARTNLSLAAMLAPMAFNDAMIHLGHSIAHSIGAVSHVTHGTCCALSTPIMLEFIADMVPARVRRLGEIMGLDLREEMTAEEIGKQVADSIRAFCKKVGLATTLSEAGVDEAALDSIATLVEADGGQFFSPKRANKHEALAMLKKIY
ncbi:iron-containing alcohol dehydrogenase [Moorella sulfitireducens (nom. illeg.)]|uniref:iron-containing alcohol dehydrogenase n=1 Tax=Neomoorella sulfitireducens TaxID=2972948 RepID=UPI0021ACB674|nr:iron-containing alcohol dehydrogenase [Moorella sulfitireducens]